MTKIARIKPPKQWKHWCQKAGLSRYGSMASRSRYLSGWFYLKGHGRVWRLNCHNQLQCGDTYADFDRWALCNIEQAPCPSSLAEFRSTVKDLLAQAREHDRIRASETLTGKEAP